jgi:hypothetical protein
MDYLLMYDRFWYDVWVSLVRVKCNAREAKRRFELVIE